MEYDIALLIEKYFYDYISRNIIFFRTETMYSIDKRGRTQYQRSRWK